MNILVKNNEKIIPSLLYMDRYKLFMAYYYFNENAHTTKAINKYLVTVRNDFDFEPYIDYIKDELTHLCNLKFTNEEIKFLEQEYGNIIKNKYFFNYLANFKLDYNEITFHHGDKKNFISYTSNDLIKASLSEIYILVILQTIYTRVTYTDVDYANAHNILSNNISNIIDNSSNTFKFIDFSCRRAISPEWLDYCLSKYSKLKAFLGTSCIYFAYKYNYPSKGTIAHEVFLYGQSVTHPFDSQEYVINSWNKLFNKSNTPFLTDTFTTQYFVKKVMNTYKNINSFRIDSGNPIDIANRIIIAYYTNNTNNPNNPKTNKIQLIFSNKLTFNSAMSLDKTLSSKNVEVIAGIGTNLGNDVGNDKALQIVMKPCIINNKPVVKISDDEGKSSDNSVYKNFILDHINSINSL